MKNRQIELKLFLLTDYEKEEKYLREKQQNGWRFEKVHLPGIYYFEKCEPEDVVYRLDFNPQNVEDKGSYIQMFEDYGWEYMQDLNEYSYFRKKAVNVNQEDLEIFSDNESKLAMLQRIFIKRMLPILTIFVCCFIPVIGNWTSGRFTGAFGIGYLTVMTILFVFYLWMILHCGIGFYRLNKKYRQ